MTDFSRFIFDAISAPGDTVEQNRVRRDQRNWAAEMAAEDRRRYDQDFGWRQEEARRSQANSDRDYALRAQAASRAAEGPPPTDDIREYQYYLQQEREAGREPIPFRDWFGVTRRPTTEINLPGQPNIGTIPAGYQAVQDRETGGWTMSPIPGGPAAAAAQQEQAAQEAQARQQNTQRDVVHEDIGRTREIVTGAPWFSPAVGFGAPQLAGIPGTNASDTKSLIDTIVSNIGFDRLQAMRDASPTGGALGQVTERELALLQSTLGSLAQTQSREQFLENLARLEQIYAGVERKAAAYPNASQFGFAAGGAPASVPPSPGGAPGPSPDGPPPGVDPGDWQYMTPEERALWR